MMPHAVRHSSDSHPCLLATENDRFLNSSFLQPTSTAHRGAIVRVHFYFSGTFKSKRSRSIRECPGGSKRKRSINRGTSQSAKGFSHERSL